MFLYALKTSKYCWDISSLNIGWHSPEKPAGSDTLWRVALSPNFISSDWFYGNFSICVFLSLLMSVEKKYYFLELTHFYLALKNYLNLLKQNSLLGSLWISSTTYVFLNYHFLLVVFVLSLCLPFMS